MKLKRAKVRLTTSRSAKKSRKGKKKQQSKPYHIKSDLLQIMRNLKRSPPSPFRFLSPQPNQSPRMRTNPPRRNLLQKLARHRPRPNIPLILKLRMRRHTDRALGKQNPYPPGQTPAAIKLPRAPRRHLWCIARSRRRRRRGSRAICACRGSRARARGGRTSR